MPRVVLRGMLKDHQNLINAFKHGIVATQKRRFESAYTTSGQRKIFTKEAFGIDHTKGEIFGTAGWNFPELAGDAVVSFFPAFEAFAQGEYTKWTDESPSEETFKKLEPMAIDALKADLTGMYDKLKPEILAAAYLIKFSLFGSDEDQNTVGSKRKLHHDKGMISSFVSNNEDAIDDIKALRGVCSDAQKYLAMIIDPDLSDE